MGHAFTGLETLGTFSTKRNSIFKQRTIFLFYYVRVERVCNYVIHILLICADF